MLSNLAASETTSALDGSLGSLDDKALVVAAQSGNSLAFVELCQRHSTRLLWRITRITKNREDAEDAVQDALLRAYRSLHRFENRCAFSSWLTAIGINSALMLLRRNRKVGVSLDDSYDYLEISEPAFTWHRSVNPESHYEWQERQSLLNAAIHRLPRLLRTVTELRIDREYSLGEIARALRISESAVKSRLARARYHLREALAGAGIEAELDSRYCRLGPAQHPSQSPFEARSARCSLDPAA
jgi:RNA polymerase sigma-70 factor (ECF subfamily)